MVTLKQLYVRLAGELRLTRDDIAVPAMPLSGVHISELTDPTPYLEGGELLLTTGIPITGAPLEAVDSYVERLVDKKIAALGLGLGEGADEVSPALLEACERRGLPLLLVPRAVPFMHVSRGYWELVGKTEQSEIASRVGLQLALSTAATRAHPTEAILGSLAQGLGGWAAYVPADGSTETVWPVGARELMPQLRLEMARFSRVETISSATFPLNGADVVEHSIMVGRRRVGYLAVGSGRRLQKADRQLILTSCMLLSLTVQRAQDGSRAEAKLAATVATLLFTGHIAAARVVLTELPALRVGAFARVLAVRGEGTAGLNASELALAVAALVGVPQWLEPSVARSPIRCVIDGTIFVVLDDGESARKGESGTGDIGRPITTAALGTAVPLERLSVVLADLDRACRGGTPGSLTVLAAADVQATTWIETLAAQPRGDLVETVRAYLAHRGNWERAARQLGIHRNSLRNRIALASELIGADLDDPDSAAPLWLALRAD